MPDRIDMSSFEEQFTSESPEVRLSPKMSNDNFDRLAFLNVRIDDIDGERELLLDQLDQLEIQQGSINYELAQLRKKIEELLNQRRPVDEAISLTHQIGRHNKGQKEAYERERARLLQELAAREMLALERSTLLKATENFPWQVGVDGKKALPHQIEGAYRLVAAERAILGDKPGLGKTLQAIMTIDLLRAKGKGKKVIIFTPKSVLLDFKRAFKRWTNPTFVHVLNNTLKGMKGAQLEMLMHFPEAILITNYEVWRKDASIHEKLIQCGFDTIVLDEGHLLKNSKSATSRKIRELVYAENLCPKCGGRDIGDTGKLGKLCFSCDFQQENFGDFCSIKNVYVMTGTPILNRPQDLWPPLELIDREGFPREKNFLDDYCTKKYDYSREQYYYTFGEGGSERLLNKLGMKYTARTRESAGVVMPPQEVKHHWLELDPEKYPKQHKFVADLRESARIAFSEEHQITANAVLAWYTRMRQAASWPDGIEIKGCPHSPPCEDEFGLPNVKNCSNVQVVFPPPDAPPIGESVIMDESQQIIEEAVEDGDRIVVFSMFRSVLAEIERRCEKAGLRHAKIVGGVPDSKRQEFIDDFNTNHTKVGEHKYDVLLCQYQTADTGLNLNGAQQVLCVERQWNPGKEEQTIDRVRRIDSNTESIVHVLHCAGTATELIDAIIDQKEKILEGFEAEVDLQEEMRKFLEG